MTIEPVQPEHVRSALPTLAAPQELAERIDRTHPAIVLPQQLLLAQERAAWLGAELRAQVEREGLGGVVGHVYAAGKDGERVEVSEALRALFEAERAERVHAASLAERIARLGLDAGRLGADSARWVAESLRALVRELGLSDDDEDTLHAARRAGFAGRRAAGADDGDPDVLIGPRLTAAQRARLLRTAAEAAEREAATLVVEP